MDLADYEKLKFQLSGVLRGVRRPYAQAWRQKPAIMRELFARLAEDRFTIAMVGRFSRGKTSLMNAILATDLLPTGATCPVSNVARQTEHAAVANLAKAIMSRQTSWGRPRSLDPLPAASWPSRRIPPLTASAANHHGAGGRVC